MRRLFLSVLIAAVRFFLVMNDRDSFEKITPQSAQKKTTSISALFFFIKRVRAEGHSLNSTFAVSREPGNNAAFCCSLVSLAHHALHLPLAVSKITHTDTLQMQFERASQTLVRTKAWHLQVPFILLCFFTTSNNCWRNHCWLWELGPSGSFAPESLGSIWGAFAILLGVSLAEQSG